MVNTAAIITAVLLAISALYAFKNMSAVEEFQQATVSLEAEKDTKTSELKLKQKDTQEAVNQTEEIINSTTSLQGELSGIEAEIATISQAMGEKEDEQRANEDKIAGARSSLDQVGDVESLAADMRNKQDAVDRLQTEVITAESRLAIATSQVESAQREVNRLQALKSTAANNASSADLNTSIRSSITSQGFVIINGGDSRGIAANSTLSVVRGGEEIAKVKVTTVESNSAAASLVPDTLKDGYTIRSGDRVVASN